MPVLVIKRKNGQRFRVLFDEMDRALIERHTWRVSFGSRSRTPYAATNVRIGGKWTTRKMHRLIMGEPEALVDHRNCNGLDNRRKNLRVAGAELQQLNKKRTARNKSGIVGVRKVGQRWLAQGGDPRYAAGWLRATFPTKAQAVKARRDWLKARFLELGVQ